MERPTANRTDRYLEELRVEFPKLKLVEKAEDRFSRLIDRCLRVLTMGGQSKYMTRYVTTIGSTIYLPRNWGRRSDESKYIVLRHEAVHLRQFRRYTFLGMSALYLFPILPMGLALGRAQLEWEAYRETFRATFEVHGIEAAKHPKLRARVVKQFVGPAYGFMWPFRGSINRRIDRYLEEITREDRPAA